MEKDPGYKEAKRPLGSREDDMSDLNDWTITDIATSEKTAPEDRKNAEAEIARREEAGIYEPSEASQDVRDDLLSHGYGVENGKLYYPTPEYKDWLQSDRSEPRPEGALKESIDDRITSELETRVAEAKETLEQQRREQDRQNGEATLSMYENEPTIEKISRPRNETKKVGKRAFDESEKQRDLLMDEKRKFKGLNKYYKNTLDPAIRARVDRHANLPMMEEIEESNGKNRVRSFDERIEKLTNYYMNDLINTAYKSTVVGVSKAIKEGKFSESPAFYIDEGFIAQEGERIHRRLDPEDTHSKEAITAEYQFQTEIIPEIISKSAETLSPQQIQDAKKNGAEYAIYTGATINGYTGKVEFAIPLNKGEEAREFMEEAGIDFKSEKRADKNYHYAINGFANIIDAVKDFPERKEDGFKALDWYYDNFKLGNDITRFTNEISDYEDSEEFVEFLNEYLDTKKEQKAFSEAVEKKNKNIPVLEDYEDITDDMDRDAQRFFEEEEARGDVYEIFDEKAKDAYSRFSNGHRNNHFIPAIAKYKEIVHQYEYFHSIDEGANFYKAVFRMEDTGVITRYRVIRFGMNDFNIAVVAPVQYRSNDAAFVWIGKTGDNRDGWADVFKVGNKLSIREKEEIKAFNHIASKKRGLNPIENMWRNIHEYIMAQTAS